MAMPWLARPSSLEAAKPGAVTRANAHNTDPNTQLDRMEPP